MTDPTPPERILNIHVVLNPERQITHWWTRHDLPYDDSHTETYHVLAPDGHLEDHLTNVLTLAHNVSHTHLYIYQGLAFQYLRLWYMSGHDLLTPFDTIVWIYGLPTDPLHTRFYIDEFGGITPDSLHRTQDLMLHANLAAESVRLAVKRRREVRQATDE